MTRDEEIQALKARAYDLLAGMQSIRDELGQVNARIAALLATPAKPEKAQK